jgi:Domain of unknown function (DUF4132)
MGKTDLKRWTVRLLGEYSTAYGGNQFRAIRRFPRWLAIEDDRPDPVQGLRAPTVKVSLVPVFTSEELSALRRTCQDWGFADRRDAAVLAVFEAAGIRLRNWSASATTHVIRSGATWTCTSGRSGCSARAPSHARSWSASRPRGPSTDTCGCGSSTRWRAAGAVAGGGRTGAADACGDLPAGREARIAAHPLLGRLARRLVWVLDDRAVALDALGDLVDPAGELVGEGQWIRLAHPATDEFTPWQPWLARQAAPQPFAQAERDVFSGEDPSAYWQRAVQAASLCRLIRHGWHWGPASRQALREQLFRPFGAAGRVVLTIDPGYRPSSIRRQNRDRQSPSSPSSRPKVSWACSATCRW